jgi:hypothetical protein
MFLRVDIILDLIICNSKGIFEQIRVFVERCGLGVPLERYIYLIVLGIGYSYVVIKLKQVQSRVFLYFGLNLFIGVVESGEDVSNVFVNGFICRIFFACSEVPT